MHALKYFFVEAAASLRRGWRSGVMSVLTIGAGLFVLGCFLLLNYNVQRVVGRWSESAELSVYLHDDVTQEQLHNIDTMVAESGLTAERRYVSREEALVRFKEDFPDLAPAAAMAEGNPFPASVEVRLAPGMRDATGAIDGLVNALRAMGGVEDVRYDREWLGRLNTLVRAARIAGLAIVVLLALASAMTVANVVSLAAASRRAEIEIMQLVGAPLAYVRGPFVAEGILQGGLGAIAAMVALGVVYAVLRARSGAGLTSLLGGTPMFLPIPAVLLVVGGGMLLGCLGGYVVARRVR